MISPTQFLLMVITPTLQYLDPYVPYSDEAAMLLLGTAAVESRLKYLEQLHGPALGLYQIEPATHEDLWRRYLARDEVLAGRVAALLSAECQGDVTTILRRSAEPFPLRCHQELVYNLRYATAIARLVYYCAPEPLPPARLGAMARYWKDHYNTDEGRGRPRHFVERYPNEFRSQVGR